MTAEVAVLNKTAVALAADSAVTISLAEGKKIYNTANKLFALSKYHPVGIMIYGNTEFMGIPWETIIKLYKDKLDSQNFKKLYDFTYDFIKFIETSHLVLMKKQKDNYIKSIISYFVLILKEIDSKIEQHLQNNEYIEDKTIKNIIKDVIFFHYDNWNSEQILSNSQEKHGRDIVSKYEKDILKAIKVIYQKLPLSKRNIERLKNICKYICIKDRFSNKSSGIVIAGFGKDEIFPSLSSFTTDSIINNKMKYKIDNEIKIDDKNPASIHAFAQAEMVKTFMEGIDPSYKNSIHGYLNRIFEEYSKIILDNITILDNDNKEKMSEKILELSEKLITDFKDKMSDYEEKYHIVPIVKIVSMLPKNELAEMAESLVTLTSQKRKISLEEETVGGPIDVAVISKGDGYIWLKRKHYFTSELNPRFFARIYGTEYETRGGQNAEK